MRRRYFLAAFSLSTAFQRLLLPPIKELYKKSLEKTGTFLPEDKESIYCGRITARDERYK